jgi:hypothetical protein
MALNNLSMAFGLAKWVGHCKPGMHFFSHQWDVVIRVVDTTVLFKVLAVMIPKQNCLIVIRKKEKKITYNTLEIKNTTGMQDFDV